MKDGDEVPASTPEVGEQVDRLSKSRQRKSLGETRRLQDERAKNEKSKSFQRTTVVNPRIIQW